MFARLARIRFVPIVKQEVDHFIGPVRPTTKFAAPYSSKSIAQDDAAHLDFRVFVDTLRKDGDLAEINEE